MAEQKLLMFRSYKLYIIPLSAYILTELLYPSVQNFQLPASSNIEFHIDDYSFEELVLAREYFILSVHNWRLLFSISDY